MVMKSVGKSEAVSSKVKEAPVYDSLETEFLALRKIVEDAYESSVTIEEAERLAAKFLGVQLKIAERLEKADLDSRMRKSGVKARRAEVYQNEI